MGKVLGCFPSVNAPGPSHSLILKTWEHVNVYLERKGELFGFSTPVMWASVFSTVAGDRSQAGFIHAREVLYCLGTPCCSS